MLYENTAYNFFRNEFIFCCATLTFQHETSTENKKNSNAKLKIIVAVRINT